MDTIKVDRKQTKMVAHRGLAGIEKENTCSAFVAAGNRSYFGVETDVHVTKDGKYVIFHDDNLERVSGINAAVEESTYEQLRRVVLFDKDNIKGRIDLMIPSLEEYLSICCKYGKTCVLELKNKFSPRDIDNVIKIVRSVYSLKKVIFISFVLENLTYIRKKLKNQKLQFLLCDFNENAEGQKFSDRLLQLKQNSLDIDILYTSLTEENVKILHNNGIEINTWNVNDKNYAQKLINMGVDYLTTETLE